MKKSILLLFFVSFLLTPFISAQTEEEMRAWMEYMTPGKAHEWMAKSEGEWVFEGRFWMDAEGEPVKSSGTMTSKMLLGGRYLQQTNYGEMMGMPFEGVNTLAYDNGKQIYLSTWIDNMGTGIMISEGVYNEAENSIEFRGTSFDPLSKTDKSFREVVTFLPDETQKVEMYITDGDKEFKNMELIFSKK